MITIEIQSTVKSTVARSLLELAIKAVLQGVFTDAQISVAIVGDQRMRRINRETLNHDYTTDVLSFDHGETPEGRMIELIVCAPMAKREAKRRGISFKEELVRYTIHGALHAAGFEDDTEPSRKEMWSEQERVLRAVLEGRVK